MFLIFIDGEIHYTESCGRERHVVTNYVSSLTFKVGSCTRTFRSGLAIKITPRDKRPKPKVHKGEEAMDNNLKIRRAYRKRH